VTECAIVRRDVAEPPRSVPREYCNRSGGPHEAVQHGWPYPGFNPTGKRLASIYEGTLHVLDVESAKTESTFGKAIRSNRSDH